MSLINQVLNDLEKRGENAPLGEATIRAVPPRDESQWMNYVIFAVALLILAVMASRYFLQEDKVQVSSAVPTNRDSPVTPSAREEKVQPPPVIAKNIPDSELVPALKLDFAGVSLQVAPEPVNTPTVEKAEAAVIPVSTSPAPAKKPVIAEKKNRKPVAAPIKNTPPQAKEESPQNEPVAKPAEGTPLKQISPRQQAEGEFNKANLAAQEKRIGEALAGYETALHSDPTFKPARLSWVGLLLNLKRNEEAERVLQEGLKLNPHDISFAMLLARLQVERGAESLALDTLQKNLPDAKDQADYQAFMAALMQRQNRHQEAVAFFQAALQLVPNNGIWLMGLGVSLQATGRDEEAKEAYTRALDSNTLNAQLQAFVQKKLKEL